MTRRINRRNFLGTGVAGTFGSVIGSPSDSNAATEARKKPASAAPNFEDYATIEAYVDGFPVYSLGNIAYIYAVSPDVYTGVVMQEANTNPKVKIKPKKSWEIKSNPFVASMAQPGVRTTWND